MPGSRPGAEIRARFTWADGTTRLGEMFCRAPLKIAKAFPQNDGSLHVCTMDCSPGMLAGDNYRFDWHLEAGTRVRVTNQSFTRVHPSHEQSCGLEQIASVAAGARLELFPEPTMLFANAALGARTEIEVERGGTLLLAEILCAGRVGRGEAFAFHSFQNRLSVRYAGRLAFTSSVRFRPNEQRLRACGAWGEFTHWGTFLACGENANVALRDALTGALEPLSRVRGSASLTAHHGVVVSLLGQRACDLQAAVEVMRRVAQA